MENLILTAATKTTGKRVEILAYTGGIMTVPGWGAVVIDLKGLKIEGQTKLLADHDTTLGGLAGHGIAFVKDNQLYVEGTILDSTEAGKLLIDISKDGVQLQASVGVAPEKREWIQAGKTVKVNGREITSEHEFVLIQAGKLREVSLCLLGCDDKTVAKIAASKKTFNGVDMKPTIQDLRSAANEFDGILAAEKLDQCVLASAEAGESLEDFRKRAFGAVKLEKMLAARPSAPRVGFNGGDGNAPEHDVLKATWLLKMGREHIAEKQFATNKAVLDAAMKNRRVHTMELLGVRENSDAAIRASFSTNATSQVFTDSLKLVAFERWNGLPQSWPMLAKKRSVPNFHQHNTPRPYLKDGQLETVAPTGEIKHATLGDENYSVRAATKARMFGITRTDIINDQLGVLAEYVESLVYESYRTLQDDLFNAIKGAGSFFATGNGNYSAGAGTALAVAGLSLALHLMRMQTDAAGRPIDTRPHALLVPPSLEETALQILSSTQLNRTGDQSPLANPWANLNLRPIVEPRLAASNGGSDTAWYLVGDPSLVPAMTASFLNGNERPTVEQNAAPFEVLGEQWRCYYDYGIDLADHRAIVKMLGVAE